MKQERRVRDMRAGFFLTAMFVMAMAALQGCAGGMAAFEQPQTFRESEVLTMAIATEVLNQADILQNAGKIKPSDARNLVMQTDQVRDGVAIAKGMQGTDLTTANDRIQASLKAIQALRDYLIRRGGTFSKVATG